MLCRACCFAAVLVGGHPRVDHVGPSASQRAHRLHRGLPGSLLTVEVDTAGRAVTQLHHGHDVQDSVDAPVAGAGEPVALLSAAGGIQGRGAVVGGEPVPVGEAGDVTDVAPAAARRQRV